MNPLPPSLPSAFMPQEVHLRDYLGVIFRRRKTFLQVCSAVFIGVVLYTFLVKPVYEASATLHVKEEKGKEGLLGELGLSTANPVDAELEILKSRTNAEQVVKRLHLDWQITKKSEGLAFKLLDFSSLARNPSYEIELTGPGAFTVRDDDGNIVGRGETGQLVRSKGVTLLLNILRGKAGDRFRVTLLPFNDTVEELREVITAREIGRKTSIIRLASTSTNPVEARDVVNTLVQAYLEQAISFKTEEAGRTVNFVEDQLEGLRGELDNSEKNLQTYKSSAGVVKLDTEAEELVKKLSETEKARAGVSLQKKQVEFALDALKDSMRRGVTYSPAILRDDPLGAGMAAKLTDLEVQKRALLNDYTEQHPAVKALSGQIEELQRKIQATFETSLKDLTKQERTVTQQIAGYEAELKRLPEAERDLARLTRLSKVNADIYTFLLHKHEEARIAKAATIGSINIVDPAIVPDRPLKPQKGMNLILGLLAGCMLGIGLAFFQEYLDDTIKDAEEAKRIMGLPLMAEIPYIPRRETAGGDEDAISLVTRREPKSQVAEAFRSLRTSLHFSVVNREKKILLVTSTFPNEGKSVISANLTHTLSQTGARVLLIDCDLRRSSLHVKFGLSQVPGLTELLTGDTTFAQTLHDTGISGIDLITAGTSPPNPSELLGSEAMRQFLQLHREEYDHIVIDAPPVLAVTDAPVLTALADLVVVVMEAGRVPIRAARHMREMLVSVHAPLAGLVLNDKTAKGEAYGYYGGRYSQYDRHRYGYGYGYYSDEEPAPAKKVSWWNSFRRTRPQGKGRGVR
jgi:tyrosine-protein kinase Etk/Wzc